MLVVTRYVVPEDEAAPFLEQCRPALAALTARPGCFGGTVGRNADDPTLWVLATMWANVGDYRRALSSTEVKMHAVPLMYRAVDEPTAFEDLLTADPGGPVVEHVPSRAPDADSVNLGEAAGPGASSGPVA